MTSKVRKSWSESLLTQNEQQPFRPHIYFYTGLWDILGQGSEGYIYAAFNNQSVKGFLVDKIWDAIIGLGRALLTSYLRVFFSFRTQPWVPPLVF